MSRPARARIDLNALSRNYKRLRSIHGGRSLAVLKADAYGHGASNCARRLETVADGFAVAFLEEAQTLRSAGIHLPILILEGPFATEELRYFYENNLWPVIHHEVQIQMLESAEFPGGIGVWLKIDSGMHRAGFSLSQARAAYQRLSACSSVSHIVLMTHFAQADEPSKNATRKQVEEFDRATEGLVGDRSLCNSAGILGWPDARRDWARCGIALYGADPMPSRGNEMEAVMQLESEIFAVREIGQGQAVGYGGGFIADRPMRIGLVAMGYADGYPRAASSGSPVLVDGQMGKIVGRVSMDMLTVDITDFPKCGIGSTVELWGKNLDINDVADRAKTISYELLCNVKRVQKIYEGSC